MLCAVKTTFIAVQKAQFVIPNLEDVARYQGHLPNYFMANNVMLPLSFVCGLANRLLHLNEFTKQRHLSRW